MPKLNPYYQGVSPQGELNTRADAGSFGADVGAGLQNLGQGVGVVAQAAQTVEEQRGAVWAIRASSDARLNQIQAMRSMQNDPEFQKKYGEDGSGFTDAYRQQYEDHANALIASAPTPEAKKHLYAQMAQMGQPMLDDAMSFQATVASKWAASNLTTSLENDGNAVALDPTKYDMVQEAGLKNIELMPHLSQEARIAVADKYKENLAYAAGKGYIRDKAEAFVRSAGPELVAQLNPTARQQAVLNGNIKVQLPKNIGANTVGAYSANDILDKIEAVKKPSKYDAMINEAARNTGGDPAELKLRLVAESGLNPNAASKEGAVGLAQFTAATGKAYGVTDRTDAAQSINGMAMMLADLRLQSGGDQATIDKMYYGGESGANWGKNTEQYAENLAAVRATLTGGEDVHSTFNEVLASLQEPKAPTQSKVLPSWWNTLPWEKQFSLMEDAKQVVSAERTQATQQAALAEKAAKLVEQKAMNGWMDGLLGGTPPTVEEIKNNPNVGWHDKKSMYEAITSSSMGVDKTKPAIFTDLLRRINLPYGDPKKITDEKELLPFIGNGVSQTSLNQLRDELQGMNTAEGKANTYAKNQLIETGQRAINKSTMFSFDAGGAQKAYEFTQAFLADYTKRVAKGENPAELLSPTSKNSLYKMIETYTRETDIGVYGAETSAATAPIVNIPDNATPEELAVIKESIKPGMQYTYNGQTFTRGAK